MSWVTPPGIAFRARSASAAAFGCFARYSSWIVIARSYPVGAEPPSELYPSWSPGGGVEELHDPGVDFRAEAVHGRLAPARDPVDGARVHAPRDELPLDGPGVEEQPVMQPLQRGDDAVGAPVRRPRDDEMIRGHDAGDASHQAAHARELDRKRVG